MKRILDTQNTLLTTFLAELRDETIQKDSMRFRRNLERIGEVLAYEVAKTLGYSAKKVVTPLGEAEVMLMDEQVVIIPILRAAVPMSNGMLNYFDRAEMGFVAAHRHYRKKGEMEIKVESVITPSLEDKILIIVDPMIATATSLELTYEALIEKGGVPKHTHICSAICSKEGVENLDALLCTGRTTLWTVSVDDEMTLKNYIVPGIGDTGDLAMAASCRCVRSSALGSQNLPFA